VPVRDREDVQGGSFTTAYMKDFLVVKGCDANAGLWFDDTPVFNYQEWLRITEPRMLRDSYLKKIAEKYIARSTILFDTVLVQERMMMLGQDIIDEYGYVQEVSALSYAVECLAYEMSITDMHEENWGIDIFGNIKMFDIMPTDMITFDPHELRRRAKELDRAYYRFKKYARQQKTGHVK